MDDDNVIDLCDDLQFKLIHIHDLSDYILDGQHCSLKFATMKKMMLFISWMSTRLKNKTIQPSSEYRLALTYEDFNVFRQADMIRMRSKPPAPGTATPLSSHTPGSKTREAFFSELNDLFDEPDCESTETLLDQEKVDSFPPSSFQSSSNSAGSKHRNTRVYSNFHYMYPSPNNPPQDVDKSCRLSDSNSTADSLDESSTLSAQDDHLLQVDSTSLSSQDTSSVQIGFVPESEGQLYNYITSTDVFLENDDDELFLLKQEINTPSDNFSHKESHDYEKLCQDDPLFIHAKDHSLTLLYPISWYNATVKT